MGGKQRTRQIAVVAVVALALVATGCFRFADFDGDDRSDLVWLRPNGTWQQAADPSPVVLAVGTGSITGVAGDYDADGRWEPAEVTSTADHTWEPSWVTHGPAGTITFAPPARPTGYETAPYYDIVPVPGAYDGGHRTIPAWYRDFDGTWFIAGHDPVVFGRGPTNPVVGPGTIDFNLRQDQDVPVPADYDGDGTTDLAVYSPTTGTWKIRSSETGTITTTVLGGPMWVPVPADYDAVGHAQLAAFNAFSSRDHGTWAIEGHLPVLVGLGSDLWPAPVDVDGDGQAEPAWIDNAFASSGDRIPRWHVPATATTPSRVVGLPAAEYAQPVAVPPALVVNTARLTLIARNVCATSPRPPWC